MITDAALHLIVSEPETLFTTSCSLPGVLPFSVSFLFFIYLICFPFFSALLFCWRLIAAEAEQQRQHVVKHISSSTAGNSRSQKWGYWPWLEHGSELKMKVADDKCSCVRFQCIKSGLHGCALAKYELASQAGEHVNWIHLKHFNMQMVCGRAVIYTPETV